MLKVVLMDDEVLALNLLEKMLLEIEGITIVGTFTNPAECLASLDSLQPDVLFLDIEMPNMTGISMAEELMNSHIKPEIVFVTAYDQYALDAFNVEAFDYILKPLDKKRIEKTVNRLLKMHLPIADSPTNSAQMTAQFLGSFQLNSKEQQLMKWRTKKAKELAAYLIYHNTSVHRQKIMEELWPDTHIEKASTLLHTTVYQLRKRFRECGFADAVTYTEERYSLKIPIDSDVKKLKNYIANKDIEHIIDVYTADFLSMDDYVWSHQVSEEIRKDVVTTLEHFVFVDVGSISEVVRAVKKLLELEPWEERYIKKIVELYVEQGEWTEAKRIVEQYEIALQKELGIEPAKEPFLLQLYELANR